MALHVQGHAWDMSLSRGMHETCRCPGACMGHVVVQGHAWDMSLSGLIKHLEVIVMLLIMVQVSVIQSLVYSLTLTHSLTHSLVL